MAAAGTAERVPPHNDDAEKAALGAMLIDDSAVPIVRQRLRPDDFYTTAHKWIYEAVLALFSAGHKADL
ncbi:MAG: replicative DNA helicase, partial [Treponema sp.]|nr:replicative DNA helicase [Treponema sp.]